QGRWKPEIVKRFPKERIEQEEMLPVYLPDLVRIYVNSTNLFPEKLLYLKRLPRKKTYKPLVTLEFQNVEFDKPVDDDLFVFTVPDRVVPEDVTKQYLERLTPPSTTPPAAN